MSSEFLTQDKIRRKINDYQIKYNYENNLCRQKLCRPYQRTQ